MVQKTNKKISKQPIDFVLLIIVLIMLALGLVMVMSASSPTSIAETGKSYAYVKTQAISALLGLTAMYIVSKIDYRKYKKYYKLIYIAVFFLNLSVAFIGKSVGRSKKMDWNRKQVLISTIRSCKNWFNYFLRSIIN